MAAQTCTASSLADAAATWQVFSDQQFKGVLNYLLVQWLNRLGGTNYLNAQDALVMAAQDFTKLNPAQKKAAILQMIRSVAVDDGASIPTNNSDIIEASNYLIQAPDQDETTLFLMCRVFGRM